MNNKPENLLKENSELVNKLGVAFSKLAKEANKCVYAMQKIICPIVKLWDYIKYTYTNSRVKHLALYSKSDRIRKKNIKRILKSYKRYLMGF